jgi:predicted O-methyltransferase YrrM
MSGAPRVDPAAGAAAERAKRRVAGKPLYDRAVMGARLPRVAPRRDRTSRALARALARTALHRLRPEERGWVDRIEARRSELIAETRRVSPDFDDGGDSSWSAFVGDEESVPVAGLAVLLSIPQGWGEFLLRLVIELAPRSCLELGTALGLSTAYQAAALELNGGGTLTTLEGARGWASVAEEGLASLGLSDRTSVEIGPIDETLPQVLARIGEVDYAYLDADHAEGPTTAHFDAILERMAPGGVVVLDDISFSEDMRNAWNTIRGRARVGKSLAVRRLGIAVVGPH